MRKNIYILLAIAFGGAAIIDGQRFFGNSNIDNQAEAEWRWVNIINNDLEVEYEDHLLLGNILLLQLDMGFCPEQMNISVDLKNKGFLNFEKYTPKLVQYQNEPEVYYYAFENIPTGNYALFVNTPSMNMKDDNIEISDEYNQYNRFYLSDFFSTYYTKNFGGATGNITDYKINEFVEIHYNKKKTCAFATMKMIKEEESDSAELIISQNDWIRIVTVQQDSFIASIQMLESEIMFNGIIQSMNELLTCDNKHMEYLTFMADGVYKTYEFESCNQALLRLQLDKLITKYGNLSTPEELQE